MTRRGFTLLEVMIAIAVLAMIGAVTYKAFDGAYDLKSRVEKSEERDQAVRGALSRMAREISMSFLSEHYDHKRFRERPTMFKLRDGRAEANLLFTSFAHERLQIDEKSSDQAVFQYTLERDPESGDMSIFRRVNPIIDEDTDRGGEKAVLCNNVVRFSVMVWNPKDREWREEWDSNKPSTAGGIVIPPRVKIAITIKDEEGKERSWSTQSKIFIGAPLDF